MLDALKPYAQLIRIAINVAIIVAAFVGGWIVKGWREADVKATEVRATQAAVNAFREHEASVGALLEQKLATLKANRTHTETRLETITERPVYRNECLDDDGLRLIDEARRGVAPAVQPASAVPRTPS